MHQVDPERRRDRCEQRGQHQDRRSGVEQAADDQQEHVDDHQDDPGRNLERLNRGDRGLRDAADGQQPREHARPGDDDQHLRGQIHRVDRDVPDPAPRDVPVDELGDEDRVDAGDARRLGGREDPGIDAAEDDPRCAERPDAGFAGPQEFPHLEGAAFADIAAGGVPVDVAAHHQRHQEARKDAGDEQMRHRLLGGRAVEDHADRRRDDDGDGAGGGQHAGREFLVVALLAQRRVHQPADRSHGGGARPRDRAEDGAGSDRGQRQAAPHPADHRHHPGDDPLGDSAHAHQLAGEDEERDRHQRELVHAAEHHLVNRGQRHLHEEQEDDRRGGEQDDEDREAEDQKTDRHQHHHPLHTLSP